MTTRKTLRRKSQKKATYRRKSQKKATHKRMNGGYPRSANKIREAYEALKQKTKTMTLDNYEEIHSEVRALHNEAKNTGNSKLAQQIEGYEYGVINQEIKKLHSKNEAVKEPINTIPEEFLE
jgi:hypothetical protein